jgi:hypothetical protein
MISGLYPVACDAQKRKFAKRSTTLNGSGCAASAGSGPANRAFRAKANKSMADGPKKSRKTRTFRARSLCHGMLTLTPVLDMPRVNLMVGARAVEHMISQPKDSSSPRFLPAEISPAARMERFAALQKKAFALFAASPEGRRRFWQRNLRKRCIHASF